MSNGDLELKIQLTADNGDLVGKVKISREEVEHFSRASDEANTSNSKPWLTPLKAVTRSTGMAAEFTVGEMVKQATALQNANKVFYGYYNETKHNKGIRRLLKR